ncbi:DUF418 domain-containing protein [Terrimonas sp. NA20]|uniref:DUF418 domain-containing protein n=1 Tax=Terrimonas ginsenosidimutans TaxID=2908004 RepID=A0ABS9KQH8_9BACT|nr:DUF418 domain-containing protein [Terrimonas ginsenosidimutans]MCG2614583.1 DUF418 domain-containing protein [Terrimonas ginsenosidimutans]
MSTSYISVAPVNQQDRITLIDSLRGIAILGILLMNIPGFGLPSPLHNGDLAVLNETGANFKAWYYVSMSVEGTQRALFSMLFGAGMILFISRKEKNAEGLIPADYFFRRQLWLLVFGLFNAFVLLWFWDVLYHYAIAGMILFAFRKLSAKSLIIAALICLVLQFARENVNFYRDKRIVTTGEMLATRDTSVLKLTEDESAQLGAMTEMKEKSTVEAKRKAMEKSLRKVRGSYAELYEYQSERSFRGETAGLYYFIWDVLVFMFLGMAFYKNGILTGVASTKVYWLLCLGGLIPGCILTWFYLQHYIDLNFDNYQIAKSVRFDMYAIARGLRSVGILGLIMLLYRSGLFKWFFALMRPVGQMAFTNYLTQSFLMGLFFYGVGFGMFGKLQRYEIYYVVVATWVLQIIWSHIWLRFFLFGPMEWLWRSLTYWKRQPMRK